MIKKEGYLRRDEMGRKRNISLFLSLSAILFLFAGYLLALDIYVEQRGGIMGAKDSETIQHIWITRDKMRLEDSAEMEVIIVRLDRNLVWIISLEYSTYQEMSLYDFREMMDDMRAMIGGIRGEVNIRKTGNWKKIRGWNCNEVSITERGRPEARISMWLTNDVQLPRGEYEKYIEVFGAQFYGPNLIERLKTLSGYPIISHTWTGWGIWVNEVITIKTYPIPWRVFELPRGVTRIE
jgi:hypothetical protein